MDMNKVLSAMEQSGMSMDEFVQKLREAEHTKRIEAKKAEEAKLAAEAAEKAKREAETARALFITEIANKTLAHGLTADDVAWLFREYISQENHDLNQEMLAEAIDGETIDTIASMTVEAVDLYERIEKGENPVESLISTLLGATSAIESNKRAKKAPVKQKLSDDEVIRKFLKSIM